MKVKIDLDFRPDTYFHPQQLERDLLTRAKSAVPRSQFQGLLKDSRGAERCKTVLVDGISADDRKVLESIHPMYMGGNYLPEIEEGEVEIGRITIKTTTYDVTCVYARPIEGGIQLRVVDEYDGGTLQTSAETRTKLPITLGQFADFFLQAWPLLDVLEMNCGEDIDASLDFFVAESAFYPDFDNLCQLRVINRFSEAEAGDDTEE